MKERKIVFPFDDADQIGEKIMAVKRIVGEENVTTCGIGYKIPEITVRCKRKEWKEIRFQLDLINVYW